MNAVVKEIGQVTDENTLRGLDYHIFVDVSSSTERGSRRLQGQSRLAEMREEVQRIAAIAERYDNDGITLSTFGTGVKTWDNITADKVESTFSEIHSGGQTFLGKAIREIQTRLAADKNRVAIIFTDGEASDPAETVTALRDLGKATGGRPKVGIVIIQVGDDPTATAFLEQLDNKLKERGIPDMVATVGVEQSEGLTFGQLVWLAQNA